MAVHRHPAAAAQVSVCSVMTVIVQKEPSCNCAERGRAASFRCTHKILPLCQQPSLCPSSHPPHQAVPSNHRNRSLTCWRS